MKTFMLYGHGGAYNRGAEAIVNTTIQIIKEKYPDSCIFLSSHFPNQDKEFIQNIDNIYEPNPAIWELEKKCATADEKYVLARKMYAKALSKIDKDTVCLSVGGDNYCYPNWHRLAVFQERATAVGASSILWGASVEPSAITSEMLDVLASHSRIIARESLTYNALAEHCLTDKLAYSPDSAFMLKPKEFPLPDRFRTGKVIGINISPLIMRKETKPGILMDNIIRLIKYIVAETDFDIMLIPHVVMPMDNDYAVLSQLYDSLSEDTKPRTHLLGDSLSAAEYKYAISKCASLICARTHASIAAYSLGIPTLVIGYSIKSQGIALDLGMSDYVLGIEQINAVSDLLEMFIMLQTNAVSIKNDLEKMPEYISKVSLMSKYI